ncbi:MAG: hypothetical protein ACP5PN_11260 [Steroidobacteraceae bacterium]
MSPRRLGLARMLVGALGGALALSACALVGPPYTATHRQTAASARRGVIQQPNGVGQYMPPAASAAQQPIAGTNAAPPAAIQYRLGPAAQALVATAQRQQRGGHYGLAAETLERALSIEPRDPLVWLALSRESLSSGNAAQAYGMARKALYLASGDASVQASAWGMIAATLRAEGRNQAALAAEHKAALLSVQ